MKPILQCQQTDLVFIQRDNKPVQNKSGQILNTMEAKFSVSGRR